MKVTYFKNIFELNEPIDARFETCIKRIREGYSHELINKIRLHKDKSKRDEIKKQLPCIMFQGTFENRRQGAIPKVFSKLIVIDIDNLDNAEQVKSIIIEDKFVHVCFISPSGNGLKVLVKISEDIGKYVLHFNSLKEYFKLNYNIDIDNSGKNINRVCYESYDKDIYYNKESEIYTNTTELKPNAFDRTGEERILTKSQIIDYLVKWWEKRFTFLPGHRSDSLFKLVAAFNEFGVTEFEAKSYCSRFQQQDFTLSEIHRLIKATYKRLIHKHNTKSFRELNQIKPTKEAYRKDESEIQRIFWTYDKGKLKINEQDLINFINTKGFFLYYSANEPDCYYLIRIIDNIIDFVDTRSVKEIVLNFIRSKKDNLAFNKVASETKYFSMAFLNALPVIEPEILKDTKEYCFVPTEKYIYRISKKEIVKLEYDCLQNHYIWKSQIIKKDLEFITDASMDKCDFMQFTKDISGNYHKELCTIIGYLIHNYKSPSNAKAISIFDKNFDMEKSEPEGGTGKSLLIEAIRHIREVAFISGDRVNFNSNFLFQEIRESSQIAWVDEISEETDMKLFFSRITGDLPLEKKNQNVTILPFEKSPKFVFTHNFRLKGTSSSHERRRVEFAVEKYYSNEYSPKDKFKRDFFHDWDKYQWDLFFTFMIQTVQLYLQNGIIKQKDFDVKFIVAASETTKDFANWYVDSKIIDKNLNDGSFNGKQLYFNYISDLEINTNEIPIRKFYGYLKKIYKVYGIKFEQSGKGEKTVFKIWK